MVLSPKTPVEKPKVLRRIERRVARATGHFREPREIYVTPWLPRLEKPKKPKKPKKTRNTLCRTTQKWGTLDEFKGPALRAVGLQFQKIAFSYRDIRQSLRAGHPVVLSILTPPRFKRANWHRHLVTLVGVEKNGAGLDPVLGQ